MTANRFAQRQRDCVVIRVCIRRVNLPSVRFVCVNTGINHFGPLAFRTFPLQDCVAVITVCLCLVMLILVVSCNRVCVRCETFCVIGLYTRNRHIVHSYPPHYPITPIRLGEKLISYSNEGKKFPRTKPHDLRRCTSRTWRGVTPPRYQFPLTIPRALGLFLGIERCHELIRNAQFSVVLPN